jgi:hypothetical protein
MILTASGRRPGRQTPIHSSAHCEWLRDRTRAGVRRRVRSVDWTVATRGVGPRVFRQAPFVILDEPTTALDPRAEHDLFERIRTLLAGRAVLLISHRFQVCETRTVLMCWTADAS